MPPPKPAEPPLQGPERLLAEFFPAGRILRSALHAVLLDGIRDHVAHRFHPFLSPIYLSISLSLSPFHARATPLLCAQTRGTIHNKGSARRLNRLMAVVAENRYMRDFSCNRKRRRRRRRKEKKRKKRISREGEGDCKGELSTFQGPVAAAAAAAASSYPTQPGG